MESPVGGDTWLTENYDTRHLNTNALFIQAVWNYYAWTGDEDFRAWLNDQLEMLRDAMQYQLDWLGGGTEYVINACNHQGEDHRGIHNEDVLSNYWDILPFGGKDAYASIDFYNSLLAMAQIEYALGNNVEGYSYSALAGQAKIAYNNTFWSLSTNRYIGAIDCNEVIQDYGFTFVNIQALEAELGDSTKAELVYDWLDSGDIYSRWQFAPRSSDSTTQDAWRRINANHYEWNQQIQDGGANLYVSGYDVIARAKYLGADNAYARLKEVLERYSEPDKLTGGSPTIFNETIQGGSDGAGSLGVMSHEFPESGIAGSSFLYAFIGLEPKWDGLHINPRLPGGQQYIGAKNINYRGMNLNFHITDSAIQIECTSNENIGESYYVIDGTQKQFPSDTFQLNEFYGPQTIVADFQAEPTVGCAPLAVQFTDQSTGDITSWLWDFGDNETTTEQSPNHTYSAPATYTVSLTVIGDGGEDTKTETDYISAQQDSDGDDIPDDQDNCPTVYNPDQADSDGDGVGDACQGDHCRGDFDGDGDVDASDLAVFAADFGRTDCDQGDPCEGNFNTDTMRWTKPTLLCLPLILAGLTALWIVTATVSWTTETSVAYLVTIRASGVKLRTAMTTALTPTTQTRPIQMEMELGMLAMLVHVLHRNPCSPAIQVLKPGNPIR